MFESCLRLSSTTSPSKPPEDACPQHRAANNITNTVILKLMLPVDSVTPLHRQNRNSAFPRCPHPAACDTPAAAMPAPPPLHAQSFVPATEGLPADPSASRWGELQRSAAKIPDHRSNNRLPWKSANRTSAPPSPIYRWFAGALDAVPAPETGPSLLREAAGCTDFPRRNAPPGCEKEMSRRPQQTSSRCVRKRKIACFSPQTIHRIAPRPRRSASPIHYGSAQDVPAPAG